MTRAAARWAILSTLLFALAVGCRAEPTAGASLRDDFRRNILGGRTPCPLKPEVLAHKDVGAIAVERVRFTPEEGQDAVAAIYRPKADGKYPTPNHDLAAGYGPPLPPPKDVTPAPQPVPGFAAAAGGTGKPWGAAAEFARNFSGQPDRRCARERGQQAQTEKRFAEQMPSDPGDEGDQRRLIDVARVQMLGTGEVIKFVAKNSVPVRDQEMEDEFRGCESQNDCGAARTAISPVQSPLLRMLTVAGVFPGLYIDAP